MASIIKYFSIAFAALVLLVVVSLPFVVLKPLRVAAESLSEKHTQGISPAFQLEFDALDIEVEPGMILKGWFIYSSSEKTKGMIIVNHGVGWLKEGMLDFHQL